MATWIIHLRVADRVAERFRIPDETAFAVGNIAPDSGLPAPDGNGYIPPKKTTHFCNFPSGDPYRINADGYAEEYLSREKADRYSERALSFYLGYYTHLLTDVEWAKRVYDPVLCKHEQMTESEQDRIIKRMKHDWYDIDFLYLETYGEPRMFRIYKAAEGFTNEYLPFFGTNDFDTRRSFITGFYQRPHGRLHRFYPYLTPAQADRFVQDASETIFRVLEEKTSLVPM